MHKKKWRKAALAFSAFLFVLWWALGTGATLAWFSDHDEVRNEFQVGLLKLDVSYKNDLVTEYTPLEDSTEVFNDEALYEPGYTQVVYLKIENKGDVGFDYKVAVTVKNVTTATSVLGNNIYLPEYLRYGVVFAQSEGALLEEVETRLKSWNHADTEMMDTWNGTTYNLDTWSATSDYILSAEDAHYAALIVYMPTEVGNAANYRGGTAPKIELGITVFAQQAGTLEK